MKLMYKQLKMHTLKKLALVIIVAADDLVLKPSTATMLTQCLVYTTPVL